jgi:hypothetical protein
LHATFCATKGVLVGASSSLTLVDKDLATVYDFFQSKVRGLSPQQLTHKEQLEYFETYLVTNLEKQLGKTIPVSLDGFFQGLVAEVMRMLGNMSSRLNAWTARLLAVQASQDTIQRINSSLQTVGNPDDLEILAELLEYELINSTTCIFVVLDYREILRNAASIKAVTSIICCDPLYLLHNIKNP